MRGSSTGRQAAGSALNEIGRSLRRISIALVALLGACELPEPTYRTEYIDLALVDWDEPYCRGTLDDLDEHIERTAALFDTQVDRRFEVYVYDEPPVDRYGAPVGGYYDPATKRIHTLPLSLEHELVHAATDETGHSIPFFEEGVAVDLTGSELLFGGTHLSSNLGARVVGYATVGHFMRWVRNEYGPATVRRLKHDIDRTSSDVYARQRFEEIMGMSLAEVEATYYATAPVYYPSLEPFSPAFVLGEEDVHVEAAFDCDSDPETLGHSGLVYKELDFEVERAGVWTVRVEPLASQVLFSRRRLEPLYELPVPEFGSPIHDSAAGQSGYDLPVTLEDLVYFSPGTYQVRVSSARRPRATVELSFIAPRHEPVRP